MLQPKLDRGATPEVRYGVGTAFYSRIHYWDRPERFPLHNGWILFHRLLRNSEVRWVDVRVH